MSESEQGTQATALRMKYFVLKPKGVDPYAAASRAAMRVYAREINGTNPVLAEEILKWADEEWANVRFRESEHER